MDRPTALHCIGDGLYPALHGRTHRGRHRHSCVASSQAQGPGPTIPAPSPGKPKAKVVVRVQRQVQYGEILAITGDLALLGSWNTDKALGMHWHDGHVWLAEVEVEAG